MSISDTNSKIMTHMVAYYPNREESLKVAKALTKNGADILEIQFPFSDPTADGKYIEMACTTAIKNGFTIDGGFNIIKEILTENQIDIFIMSYANLVYFYGIENWINMAIDSGASGLIIPDLPFDYDEGLYRIGKLKEIEVIPVITPDISNKRLEEIIKIKPKYIYTTLRKGITGSKTVINDDIISFLRKLHNKNIKILGGFGIYEKSQINQLSKHVYAVVVGSAFIKAIIDNSSVSPHISVGNKLKELIGNK